MHTSKPMITAYNTWWYTAAIWWCSVGGDSVHCILPHNGGILPMNVELWAIVFRLKSEDRLGARIVRIVGEESALVQALEGHLEGPGVRELDDWPVGKIHHVVADDDRHFLEPGGVEVRVESIGEEEVLEEKSLKNKCVVILLRLNIFC